VIEGWFGFGRGEIQRGAGKCGSITLLHDQ
jgi:hypothetical protein